jgi:transketolase
MRSAFVQALCQLASVDKRVLLLTADLGFLAFEPFRNAFPDRFFNIGVAEQNMIGMATGLAEAGFVPYTYSIATFASLRPFEFIRNGPVRHQLPVRMVGMGMGFEYGHAGSSHYALEDVSALRSLNGLTIVIPADSAQASRAIHDTWSHAGPIYYSLGKDDHLSISGLQGRFHLGRLEITQRGADLAILAMGSVAVEAAAAASELSKQGIQTTVAIVSSFNPDPIHDVTELLSSVSDVITVEAQSLAGGLGSFVAMVIASQSLPCRLWPLAVNNLPNGRSGSQSERWSCHGLDRASIVRQALSVLKRSSIEL